MLAHPRQLFPPVRVDVELVHPVRGYAVGAVATHHINVLLVLVASKRSACQWYGIPYLNSECVQIPLLHLVSELVCGVVGAGATNDEHPIALHPYGPAIEHAHLDLV